MADVRLKVGTRIYRGWTALKVQRGIEQAAGAFGIGLTERWPGQPRLWPIEPGEACTLLLDGTAVITGYIDSVERRIDASTHAIKVIGRDKAGDIVDCSAVMPGDKTGSLHGQTLLQAARMLCEPHGITVSSNTDADLALASGDVEPSETVWENIERYARQKAVLVISDGRGGLVITRAGKTVNPNAIVEGKTVLSATLLRDNSQRFNRYRVSGQAKAVVSDSAKHAAHSYAETTDSVIRDNRLFTFEPDTIADGITLKDVVKWERNVRRARSRRVGITLQGWSVNGRVWQPNEMVSVTIPTLGIDGRLLIVSVTHVLDNQGSRTELVLSPREAYDLLPKAADTAGDIDISPETQELLG